MIYINKFLYSIYIIIVVLTIYISIFHFIQTTSTAFNNSQSISSDYHFSNSDFCWPVPGYHNITSPFGPRISPTTGASRNHSGIDIGAAENSNIYSITNGLVVFVGFQGANGCTIMVESNNLHISYCHVSPNFIVSVGQIVTTGEHIANVGPKNVYGIPNNPYKDFKGNPTNGATTGCHLHFGIKKDGIAVNPLDFF